jgi:hypothetical protein
VHPEIQRAFDAIDSEDPETLLRRIEAIAPGPLPPAELLDLAFALSRRGHPLAAETLLWQVLRRVPDPAVYPSLREAIASLPSDYEPSPRLKKLSQFLPSMPPPLLELFRHGERPPFIRTYVEARYGEPLAAVASTRELYPRDAPGGGWAPIHAIRLLGEIRAIDSVPHLLRGLQDPEIFDYAHAELVHALGLMGRSAMEQALEALGAAGMDEFQIISLMQILRNAAIVEPDLLDRAAEALLTRARDDSLPPEVRGFALRYLLETGHRAHEAELRQLIGSDFLDRAVAIRRDALEAEYSRPPGASAAQLREKMTRRFQSLYSDSRL